MAVRKKGRRKIVVDNEEFIWYVKDDDDGGGLILHILSQDKKLIILYPLDLEFITKSYLAVTGIRFEGYQMDGSRQRFECPQFHKDDGIITPKIVKEIIVWCLNSTLKRVKYMCYGRYIV